MQEFLKKIGVGKNHWKDLTYNEAYSANLKIIDGESTDIQTGAFWSIMRVKYSSIEELKGFLDAFKEDMQFIEAVEYQPVDLAVGYDGKNRTVHILPAAIFIATGAGAKVVGHGNEHVPSKYGVTYHEILKIMGCNYLYDKGDILKTLELSGFAFYHQKYFHPKLSALLPKRREFGLRTYINTVEKLLNPFHTNKVLIGMAHSKFIDKYIQLGVYAGFKDVFVVQGLEGGIEPFPNKETKVHTNKIFSISILPKSQNNTDISVKLTPEENADLCLSILRNKENYLREWAIMTAGLIINSYYTGENITESIKKAEESLKSGAAYENFQIYKSLTGDTIL